MNRLHLHSVSHTSTAESTLANLSDCQPTCLTGLYGRPCSRSVPEYGPCTRNGPTTQPDPGRRSYESRSRMSEDGRYGVCDGLHWHMYSTCTCTLCSYGDSVDAFTEYAKRTTPSEFVASWTFVRGFFSSANRATQTACRSGLAMDWHRLDFHNGSYPVKLNPIPSAN